MTGFLIKTGYNDTLRFQLYLDGAPLTCAAFLDSLPFSGGFIHPGFLRKEIWALCGPQVNILPENAFALMEPGEIAIGFLTPHDTRSSKRIGICYGEAKPINSCNVFGKVFEEDLHLLKVLCQTIWRYGELNLSFEIAFSTENIPGLSLPDFHSRQNHTSYYFQPAPVSIFNQIAIGCTFSFLVQTIKSV